MENNKILTASAKLTSLIFHPLLIPTIGFLLLFSSGFYFALLPWRIMKFVLLIVFLSTGVMPALSIGILALNPRFDRSMSKSTDRIMPLMVTSVFYYMGYIVLKRIPIFPIYNFILIASILVQIVLLIVSFRWKISAHAAAIGSLLGTFFTLSFRTGANPVRILVLLVLIAGLVGSSRLILEKHTSAQVYASFFLGVTIMLAVFSFV
jgi:hypothetical protein